MDNPKVIVKKTKEYGLGVFAVKAINKNEVIASFDGPVYDDDFEPWTEDMYNHAIQFGRAVWRDSNGIARLINHSCEPNSGIKNLFNIVAMRRIAAGEQITWDYEMTEKNTSWQMRCRCQSSSCRGVIGNFKNMPKQVRKKYGSYISDWLIKPPSAHRKFVSIICLIPKGKVATYGQIAALAGCSGQARQVARALHSSSDAYIMPWHRVIAASGEIAFKRDYHHAKQKFLLEQEGIVFDRWGKTDLHQFQWAPKLSTIKKAY